MALEEPRCRRLDPAAAISPFDVVVTPANYADAAQREAANAIYAECRKLGLDALLDDRDERPGVKFKDADLIGVPYRITVGKKLAEGLVEISGAEDETSENYERRPGRPPLCGSAITVFVFDKDRSHFHSRKTLAFVDLVCRRELGIAVASGSPRLTYPPDAWFVPRCADRCGAS